MKQEDIRQIKRLICLEDKISNIRLRYPEVNNLDKAEKILFFSNKMHIEEKETLTLSDWEYFNIACILPYKEISELIEEYDNKEPKPQEMIFLDSLQLRYNVDRNIIIQRIKEVRKINNYIREQNPKFEVMAVPCNRAFVVDPAKTNAFLSVKPNPEIRSQQEEIVEIFRKNNLIEDNSKVKKIGQKIDKK